METITAVLSILGLAFLGFIIAEFQNAFLGKQEKTSKIYFSIIGVEFTQKDFQRLVFALALSIGVMFLLPLISGVIGVELKGQIIYIVTGYSPSTVLMVSKKIIKNKSGL